MTKEQAQAHFIKLYQDLKDQYRLFPNMVKESYEDPEEIIELFKIAMQCIGKCIEQENKDKIYTK